VIIDSDDRAARFLITDMIDGWLHIAQVSVDPGSACRGLGRALTMRPSWRPPAFLALTLATFAEVPWHAPYYLSGSGGRRRRSDSGLAGEPGA